MRYESIADVKLRLSNSLVRVKDRPVIVMDAHPGGVVSVRDVEDIVLNVKVKDLELTPVPLGFVNQDGQLLYVMRKPTRRYKQGLTRENIHAIDVFTGKEVGLNLHSVALSDTIRGVYPSVGDCFTAVREGAQKALAFSREWAVALMKDELSILHKGVVVGYVGDKSVMLNPEKYFLKESLTESLNV